MPPRQKAAAKAAAGSPSDPVEPAPTQAKAKSTATRSAPAKSAPAKSAPAKTAPAKAAASKGKAAPEKVAEPAKAAEPAEAAEPTASTSAEPESEPGTDEFVPNRAERRAKGKNRGQPQPAGRGKVYGGHGPASSQRNWANRRSGG